MRIPANSAFHMIQNLPCLPPTLRADGLGFHQQRPRRLLLANGIAGMLSLKEDAAGSLPGLPVSSLQVSHSLGMQAAALQHLDAVFRLADGTPQQLLRPP